MTFEMVLLVYNEIIFQLKLLEFLLQKNIYTRTYLIGTKVRIKLCYVQEVFKDLYIPYL